MWQLDDRDDDWAEIEPRGGFASRLARQLVIVYSRHGETILDLDGDNHLHAAAVATGRSYLTGIEATGAVGLDHSDQPVGLVTLRWPRTADLSPAGSGGGRLFSAGRLPVSDDACVIATIRSGSPTGSDQAGGDHARSLCAVAEAAGLTPVLRIVAIGSPGDGDRLRYYATEAEATYAATQATTAPIPPGTARRPPGLRATRKSA
ncbi:hypothetical protein [Micromonospora musae]|uniref:hypothetical protein n=1 Tax=Micromonospora musae TaxID=1894970 RepID=UPI0011C4432B|nr:hypothetical protein [Micromonospora musae]